MLAPLLRVSLLVLSSMSVVLRLLVILSLMALLLVLLEVLILMVGPLVRLTFRTRTALILMMMRMMLPYTAILRTVVLLRRNLCGNGLGLRGGEGINGGKNFVARHLIRNLHRPPPPYLRPFSLLFPLSDLLLAAPFSLDSNSPAAIPTAEAALDGGVPTATSSTGRDDDGGVDGIVDVDGDDFAWVDQWIEDGGDAAGFWAAPGEAGPLTGGIWGTPIGGETLADGVVAVGEAVAGCS
jgi:hypothetical protein